MWKISICFFLFFGNISNDQVQRLILPTSSSVFTIVPRVDMPMMSTSSINSGFSLKIPITVKFPSLVDIAQSMNQNSVSQSSMSQSAETTDKVVNNLSLNVTKTRSSSRARFYKAIERSHSNFGKICLLRAICEVAEVPFIASSTGLFGEIFDLLLTLSILPDDPILSTYRQAEELGRRSRVSTYRQAEELGRRSRERGDKCKYHFKECPLSLFNIVDMSING